MSHRFRRVPKLASWKKFSVALWPVDATRFCTIDFDLSVAKKFKESQNASWSSILIYLLCGTLKEKHCYNQFIRRYKHYTRDDIDIFLRLTLDQQKSSTESDSLWGVYLRSCQGLKPKEIQAKIRSAQDRFKSKRNRYPLTQNIIAWMPPIFTVLLVKWLAFWIRMGLPFPLISRIAYPSVSMSNTGSLKGPLTNPVLNPLTFSPLNINFGEISEVDGRTIIKAIVGFDHRVFDGQDIKIFFDCFKSQIEAIQKIT